MKNIYYFFVLIFLWSHNTVSAQDGQISGQVIDQAQNPIEFVNVLLFNAADSSLVKGEFTNDKGEYLLPISIPGRYFVQAEMIGYGSIQSEIINLEKLTKINIPNLTISEGLDLEEITVTAEKPFIELNAERMILNIAGSSINAGNSALEILAKAPGVAVDNQENISLRGKQGVLVMIDGKNQYLSNEDLLRMLENMPAAGIERIEIISNPSSKYDAEGNTGVINIVLSKNENFGVNGNLSSTYRQGIKTSHFHNLNLNYRNAKFNLFGSGEYYNWGSYRSLGLTRNVPSTLGNTNFDQLSIMNNGGDGFNLRAGIDIYVNERTTIGVLAKFNNGVENNTLDNTTNITGANKPIFDKLIVATTTDESYANTTFNLNVEHKFSNEKMKLSFDADNNIHKNNNLLNYDNRYFDENGLSMEDPYFLRNNQEKTINIFAAKSDFSWKISDKLNIETGLKYSTVKTDNATLFEYLEGATWYNQLNRSSTFEYTESVSAAYVNAQSTLGKVSLQAGLRLEHTVSLGMSVTLNQEVPRSYTDLFPSLSISHPIAKEQRLSYSYSRRLNRPNYQSLNPFVFYLDEFTSGRGNPFLNPQYAHAIGINYALDNKLYVSLDFSRTTDMISQTIEQESNDNVSISTTRNLDNFSNASATISIPKVWNAWWSSRLNATSWYNEFQSVIQAGILDRSSVSYRLQLNNDFKFANSWKVELSGRYTSSEMWGFFESNPRASVDFGISKGFFKDAARLKVGITDIFYTSNSLAFVRVGEVDLIDDSTWDSRRVSVNFSWRFGNKKMKGARERNTASDEERGRL